jgi:hypothetical protein
MEVFGWTRDLDRGRDIPAGCKNTAERLMLMLMLILICCERKTLLNGWLILTDKFKRTG